MTEANTLTEPLARPPAPEGRQKALTGLVTRWSAEGAQLDERSGDSEAEVQRDTLYRCANELIAVLNEEEAGHAYV